MIPAQSQSPWSRSSAGSYQPLVPVLAAACAGIVADHAAVLPIGVWLVAGMAAWSAWVVLWRRNQNVAALSALLVAVATAAGIWHHAGWNLYAPDELGLFARDAAEPVCFEGVALSAPRRIPAPPTDPLRSVPVGDRSRVELSATRVRDGRQWRAASGQVTLVVDGHLLGVAAGDRLTVFGRLARTAVPANPGEFDYAAFHRAERRLCSVRAGFPDAVTVTTYSAWSFTRWIDDLRTRGAALLRRDVDARRSPLASAMFLGVRDRLDADESQAFLETGTIHLLVISGMNVGILAACLLLAMRAGWMPQRWALMAIGLVTCLYAVVTDAQPPVVRATIMVLVMCLAKGLGRRALQFNVWAAAGLAVLAFNPCELFRAGTQLSFLCVAVLIWLNERRAAAGPLDPLDRLIAASRPWPVRVMRFVGRRCAQVTVASAVIWLVVCPLVMARFHLVSPIAVLIGPLVSLPVTLAMATGFGVFGFGSALPALAGACGRVCDWNLAVVEWMVFGTRRWPGSHFWVAGPADWWLAGFYGLLAAVAAGLIRPSRRWCIGMLAGWCAVGLFAAWNGQRSRAELQCTFVSVGHGSAVVVRLPDGRTLLYDAGRMAAPQAGERSIAAVLWSQGVRHLDAVILSHADTDHYNALPGLLEKFSAGVVYVSPMMFERSTPALDLLKRSIETAGVPLVEIASGDRLRAGVGCTLDISHPPRHGVLGSDNANSVVLGIEYQGRRILLTGDLESPGLDDVLAEEPFDCDILMAPHHGSRFSNPPGIARWCTPEWVVISGGDGDRSAAVEQAYSVDGSRVLHTAVTGAVNARVRAGALTVEPWRE